MEIHAVESLLGTSIHTLEVQSKRFFDSLSKVMLALSLLMLATVAVMLEALLVGVGGRGSRRAVHARRSSIHRFSVTTLNSLVAHTLIALRGRPRVRRLRNLVLAEDAL